MICYFAAVASVLINRATSVYVITVFVLAGGLWVILSYGSTLRPPTDLAGKWELTGPAGTEEMTVDQSGRFVHLITPRWAGDLKIVGDSSLHPTAAGNGEGVTMEGSGASATFGALNLDDGCTVKFEGPIAGTYQGRRTVRMYPKLEAPTARAIAAASTQPSSIQAPTPH